MASTLEEEGGAVGAGHGTDSLLDGSGGKDGEEMMSDPALNGNGIGVGGAGGGGGGSGSGSIGGSMMVLGKELLDGGELPLCSEEVEGTEARKRKRKRLLEAGAARALDGDDDAQGGAFPRSHGGARGLRRRTGEDNEGGGVEGGGSDDEAEEEDEEVQQRESDRDPVEGNDDDDDDDTDDDDGDDNDGGDEFVAALEQFEHADVEALKQFIAQVTSDL